MQTWGIVEHNCLWLLNSQHSEDCVPEKQAINNLSFAAYEKQTIINSNVEVCLPCCLATTVVGPCCQRLESKDAGDIEMNQPYIQEIREAIL